MCLFMFMLFNKIFFKKFDIKKNDELLKTIWEHMRKIEKEERERERRDIIKFE